MDADSAVTDHKNVAQIGDRSAISAVAYRMTRFVIVAVSALLALKYVAVALANLGYPYQLEWMEGGVALAVSRVRAGLSLYPPPSLSFVGFVYPPLYFWLSALLSTVTGDDLFAARLLSFLSTLSSASIIASFVWRETRNKAWACLGAGFFFTTYSLSGQWFHLARVDSLYLALLLGSLYALRFVRTNRGAALAGVFFALAFLAKQSAVVSLLPSFGLVFLLDRRRGAWALGTAAVVALPVILGLEITSHGWFSYYVLELPGRHPLLPEAVMGFFRNDMLPVALSLTGIALLLGRWADTEKGSALFYGVAFVSILVSTFLSRLHSGGYLNVLMPAFGFVALLVPMAMAEVDGGSRMFVGAVAALGIQLLILQWDVAASFPGPGAVEAGKKFSAFVSSIPGDVLLPDYQGVARAGKQDYGLGMAARDVLRSNAPDDRGKKILADELRRAFAEHRFRAVILSEPEFLAPELQAAGYHVVQTINLAPKPVTGWPITPQYVWVP